MAGSSVGVRVGVLTTRDVRPFFSNMNLLHNEGCDYGTFARAKRCCQTCQAVSQSASLFFFISHVLDALVRGISRHAVRAPRFINPLRRLDCGGMTSDQTTGLSFSDGCRSCERRK
jgi:hypothetical protein